MNSIDTNLLFYAANRDCNEYALCREFVNRALREGESWIVADQVLFELYRLLRNPAVLEKPLTGEQAAGAISWYREKSRWLRCAWEPSMMADLESLWSRNDFPATRSFDAILAVTLKSHGVQRFYTHNVKDFKDFGFFEVLDPLLLR